MLRPLLLLHRLELQHPKEEEQEQEQEEDRLVSRGHVVAVGVVLLVAEMAAVVRHAAPQQVLPGAACEQQSLGQTVRWEVALETKQQQAVLAED